jgi:intracellular septation protein A
MRLGRRTVFFAILAAVSLLLIPATPSQYVWVNYLCAGLAAFWGILLAVEAFSRSRSGRPPGEDG